MKNFAKGETSKRQIKRLEQFILDKFSDSISDDRSAVDIVIRIIQNKTRIIDNLESRLQPNREVYRTAVNALAVLARITEPKASDMIVTGLRKGQAKKGDKRENKISFHETGVVDPSYLENLEIVDNSQEAA